jgi:quercetin dioxygenase-like cupin family protein
MKISRFGRCGGLAAIIALGIAISTWTAQAQDSETSTPTLLEIMRADQGAWIKAEATHVSGEVMIQRMNLQKQKIRLSRVRFAAGARTAWHDNNAGQVLIVESGHGRVQRAGGPVKEVGPGDSIYFAPGEPHWLGADPDAPLTGIVIAVGQTEWKGQVTDQEYATSSK